MASHIEWAEGYARQAKSDLEVFELLQHLGSVPACHKLHFLQMACEKLVKAHLCSWKADPNKLQASHAYVASSLPKVLRQEAVFTNFTGPAARAVMRQAKEFAQEIEVAAPAVSRNGRRPDNCEYPWEDSAGTLHSPLDWSFAAERFLDRRFGTLRKLLFGAIRRLAP